MTEDTPIIGIDLGTTNSAVAVCRDGRVEIVENDGSKLLPSYVGLAPDGRLLVGDEARNQYVLYPDRTVRSVKRKMGSEEKLHLGEKDYLPQEISAMILRELKQHAEKHLGQSVTKAVITVPAYFNDAQRQATREAGTIAGLEVLRILNEPTAACLAYKTGESSEARTVMAFDFGGGTFDVSIVTMQQEVVEVVASHGDTHLGGDDIDDKIFEHLLAAISEEHGEKIAKTLTDVSLNRLRRAAEEAKIRLSDEPYVRIMEDNLEAIEGQRLHVELEISREDLNEWIHPLLSRTLASVWQAMSEAERTAKNIDEIILVGGSTRIAAVGGKLRDELGQTPRQDVHPELAVVYGAGVMASRLMGQDSQRILVDITPYTFGTSAIGLLKGEYSPHLFCPVIAAGTPLPVTKTEAFYTAVDGQEKVNVTVFEGEDLDARNNILIGRFTVDGLDQDAPEGSTILIAMSLDLDGILRVTATEKATGLSKNLTIERALDKMSEEQIAAAREQVKELFGDVEDEAEHGPTGAGDGKEEEREDDDAFREARRLLRRLHRAKQNMDDVDREDADGLEKKLQEALDRTDTEAVEKMVTEVDDLLFYVESGA